MSGKTNKVTTEIVRNEALIMRKLAEDLRSHNRTTDGAIASIAESLAVILEAIWQTKQ